ncbi:hypothetical protein WMY93_031504 [Mugilogobius chulae]|uniref:Uncharacterized protein n=1 Tax=Mugilogobius chulae TaxID=88201 RepID=A0AAW0ML72_9GOBI
MEVDSEGTDEEHGTGQIHESSVSTDECDNNSENKETQDQVEELDFVNAERPGETATEVIQKDGKGGEGGARKKEGNESGPWRRGGYGGGLWRRGGDEGGALRREEDNRGDWRRGEDNRGDWRREDRGDWRRQEDVDRAWREDEGEASRGGAHEGGAWRRGGFEGRAWRRGGERSRGWRSREERTEIGKGGWSERDWTKRDKEDDCERRESFRGFSMSRRGSRRASRHSPQDRSRTHVRFINLGYKETVKESSLSFSKLEELSTKEPSEVAVSVSLTLV